MSDLEHGYHDPARGWYDASRHAWLDSPGQLTPTAYRTPTGRPLDGVEFRHGHDTRPLADRVTESQAATWSPDGRLEQLRRLRDSGQPADRSAFDRICKGTMRTSLGMYEQALRAYVATGAELPDGVSPS